MAEVTWSAARDNNDPISAYVVYYNSSHDDVNRQGARPIPRNLFFGRIYFRTADDVTLTAFAVLRQIT